jgi:predicted CXXCH cytochrome family protein
MPCRAPVAVLAVLAAAWLAACAASKPAPPGRVPDAAAPPRSAFEPIPAAEAAAVKNPHAYKGKALCQRCHAPDLALTAQANALCPECHKLMPVVHKNHPVDVVQKEPSGKLPLLAGGKLACHTCHDPHQAKPRLRKKFNELCVDCHKGY